jgi:alpha-D-xyloside xylohydrolase
VQYLREGIPPFRASVIDFPTDPETWGVDDQFLVGADLMVAPVFAGESKRSVYLPSGDWFDFWTEKRHRGGGVVSIESSLERVPLFVKAGTLLPLAQATSHTEDPRSWLIEATLYGSEPATTTIYEDDGSYEPALEPVRLSWDGLGFQGEEKNSKGVKPERYKVVRWKLVQP